MPARDYPFIEIAVHPAVRGRFASGAGLAIFSPALDHVYWANGAAARQFGYDNIYAFLEDEHFDDTVLARQIAAAAERIAPGRTRQELMLRLGTGFRRVATACTLERIDLSDGEGALLLALPAERRLKDSLDSAASMIAGFDDTQTHVAVLDRDSNALAHSPLFTTLDIDGKKLEEMVAGAEAEESRLFKRQIPTAIGLLPAAIAHVCDDPSLFLLFVVEPEEQIAPSAASAFREAAAPRTDRAEAPPSPAEPVESSMPPAGPYAASATDRFAFVRSAKPVRFVWRIDADGRFSAISPEFADAVGPNAADIVGRSFEEVAAVFNLDPDGTIGDLLRRRDTWSGKTVFWPVQGEELAVPVDLAALPTYSRDRSFEGFRGFGIARLSEARMDPDRLGLALATRAQPPAEAGETAQDEALPQEEIGKSPAEPDGVHRSVDEIEDGAGKDDPFRGQVPALRIVKTPARRESDKIVDLESHRLRGRQGLSCLDQAVFDQIGAELGRRLAQTAQQPPTLPISGPDVPAPNGVLPDPEHVHAVSLLRPALEIAPEAEHVAAVALAPAPLAVRAERPASRQPVASKPESGERRADIADTGRAVLTPALVDALPVALLVHRGENLLHANPEFLSLTGHASLAALAQSGGIGALFGDAERSAIETADTLPLRTADGAGMGVRVKLQSVGWNGGHALLMAISPIGEDTSSQRRDARIRSAEIEVGELHAILETATDGVVILNEDGTIRSMNGSASALFDYDLEETRGKPFSMLFAHESQRAVLDYVAGLFDNGVASVLNDGREVIGREASGGFIPIFMTIGRLGASNGYCAVIRDITHWKRTEEELRSAKRAAESASAHKSEFLARMSHEIRTPLNAIIGFAEMMATERFGPIGSPRYLEYAHDIGRSGRHVLDIVNDLLDISKIEAGEQEMDFTAVSLNTALAETVSLLQPQANGQRVIIRTSLSNSLPEVVADARSIRQIAINLLSNAIRFTPSGGQIVVSTAYDRAGNAVMRIRDTGIGMSRNELEQAMKPFRQGGTSKTRQRGDGTGLGLPLTKAMVEANRAQFSIESVPGEGTTVQVIFPPQRVLAE